MTTRKQALEALLEKVEAGDGFPKGARSNVFGHTGNARLCLDARNGSLDAAMRLHNAVLPGWEYGYDGSIAWVKLPGMRTSYRHDANNRNPARAWLCAILRALISMEDAQ